jgi:hypothetical protein
MRNVSVGQGKHKKFFRSTIFRSEVLRAVRRLSSFLSFCVRVSRVHSTVSWTPVSLIGYWMPQCSAMPSFNHLYSCIRFEVVNGGEDYGLLSCNTT